MKLWYKGDQTERSIEHFTSGTDREMDLVLAKYDLQATVAHAGMLQKIGLLTVEEKERINDELSEMLKEIESGQFEIEEQFEDIHSKIEHRLTEKLGEAGKKIHTGRSRNDQVLVCLHLYAGEQLARVKKGVKDLFDRLLELSEQHKSVLMPGYTHFQAAMPSSFGLWFGAYAETLIDDLILLNAAQVVADQNPLGSAAGYGTSIPLDRDYTTRELNFSTMKFNSMAAQFSRGKLEMTTAFALASIAGTLARFSMDVVLYMSQNYGFISFPDHLTTGSSIMPHKKNPDVFELIRARCNRVQSVPGEIALVVNNLPAGYHRDYQELKEPFFNSMETVCSCLEICRFMLEHIEIHSSVLEDEKYRPIFSVEEVNKLVKKGMPFREAYKTVARQIENEAFNPDRGIEHTHSGSIGNLSNGEIRKKFEAVYSSNYE